MARRPGRCRVTVIVGADALVVDEQHLAAVGADKEVPVQVAGGAAGDRHLRFLVGDDQRAHVQQVGDQVYRGKGQLLGAVGAQQAEVVVGVIAQGSARARQVPQFVEAEVFDLWIRQKGAGGTRKPVGLRALAAAGASWRSPFR